MSDYRIEKVRRHVTVVVSTGAVKRVDGDVFLQPTARFRSGPERPIELLNDSDPFLPLVRPGEGPLLIAKDQIVKVEHSEEADDISSAPGASEVAVEMLLTDGSTVAGALRLEVRAERPRLLDFLNAYDGRFLLVACGAVTCLINCRCVVHARQGH